MKNTINRQVFKTALLSAFALTCVAAVAQQPTVVFTEDPTSPQGLTVQMGGSDFGTVTTVTPPGAPVQTWFWTPTSGVPLTGTGAPLSWLEPGNPSSAAPTYNTLLPGVGGVGFFTVQVESDVAAPIGDTILQDSQIVDNYFSLNGTPLAVQFIDLGDVPSSTVPDGSSTLTLLGGVLTVVGAVGRKLRK